MSKSFENDLGKVLKQPPKRTILRSLLDKVKKVCDIYMYKTQWNLFSIDTLGGVKKLRSTKHTSCSLYCHDCFYLFPLFVVWLRRIFVKMSRYKIAELLQDIWLWLASTTHLPPCHFDHFQKKKKCWSIKSNQLCLQCQWPWLFSL